MNKLNHPVISGPGGVPRLNLDPVVPFVEYPKYVRRPGQPDVIANSKEEEDELLGVVKPEPEVIDPEQALADAEAANAEAQAKLAAAQTVGDQEPETTGKPWEKNGKGKR